MKTTVVKQFLKAVIWLVVSGIVLTSCHSDSVYEQTVDLPASGWADTSSIKFEFQIANTTTPKNVFLGTRYNNEYNFHNLYLQYTLIDSTGKELVKKLDQLILFDQTTGNPLGNGFAGTTDLDAKLYYLRNYKFPYVGRYTLQVKQFMRLSPLVGIKAIGVKVKEASSK